jgi:D-3-phosphoglycerate dehydrogenase
MHAIFVDASETLAAIAERLSLPTGVTLTVSQTPDLSRQELAAHLADCEIAIVDHTTVPTELARQSPRLKDIVFLGTGARSYMNPEELAEIGVTVHIIKGYGDVAVAEMSIALMWAAAKGLAQMDREMRAGNWLRTEAVQLTGKTIGLVGFGGIAQEVARMASGTGMKVLAWNRTPRTYPGVTFTDLDTLLASSDVVSLHLLLNDETRNFLSRERIAQIKPGAILVNTARGALIDEQALVDALNSGQLRHAALDVFVQEPLPVDHPFTRLPNVTLSAHSAFRTPEASDNLIAAAFEHCRRIAASASVPA